MTVAKKNTSLVRNPASRMTLGKGKTTTRRKTRAHRNTTAAMKANSSKYVRSRRRYRRNSASSATAGLLAAFGGALVINGFDAVVNLIAPNSSGTIRMISKFGLGFLVSMYGNKLPLVRGFAPIISTSLYIAGALDVVGTYVMPHVLGLLGQGTAAAAPVVVASQPVTDPTTGEMGMIHTFSNGDTATIYNQQIPTYSDGYGSANRFAYP